MSFYGVCNFLYAAKSAAMAASQQWPTSCLSGIASVQSMIRQASSPSHHTQCVCGSLLTTVCHPLGSTRFAQPHPWERKRRVSPPDKRLRGEGVASLPPQVWRASASTHAPVSPLRSRAKLPPIADRRSPADPGWWTSTCLAYIFPQASTSTRA